MERIIGRNPVLAALKSDHELESVYIQNTISGEFEKTIRALCQAQNVPLKRVPKAKLDRDIKTNHQGIYAILSRVRYWDLPSFLNHLFDLDDNPLILILDGVQDVRNLGALVRSAEVFGAHGIIIPQKNTAHISEVAIKASAGALLHLPICRVTKLQETLSLLSAREIILLGADSSAKKSLNEINLQAPLAIIMGAEGTGIDRHLKVYCDHLFAIRQAGKISSLNVSVAGGIILYEIFNQRLKNMSSP